MKKEPSRDEEEIEDDGSTNNAEEYDPMEAEDAEDDDDDGIALFFQMQYIYVMSHNRICSDEKPR